jgi:type IV secretory pathway VirD2 relaxase
MCESDFEFEPKLGRIRSGGGGASKRFLTQARRAALKASPGFGLGAKSGFKGTRFARGGASLAGIKARGGARGEFSRRVVVKFSIKKLGVKGAAAISAAGAHMRYIQRDGVDRDGAPGALYDRERDATDGRDFLDRSGDDRHQFRIIVSPEDGLELAEEAGDLKQFTRDFMDQMERDLGTRLDWVAVDHFNTAYPHTHIVLRGREESGNDLVIAPGYIAEGMRARASELAMAHLGPRRMVDIAAAQRMEVEQDRFTSIDRELVAGQDDGLVTLAAPRTSRDRFNRSLKLQRLSRLEEMGLASRDRAGAWRLDERMEETLRAMGRKGDIIRSMQFALGERGDWRRFRTFDPEGERSSPIVGRVAAKLYVDHHERVRALVVDGLDGHQWHVELGRGHADLNLPDGAIVSVSNASVSTRQIDRTIAQIAEKHFDQYSPDDHRRREPNLNRAYQQRIIRRLEALRRANIVERDAAGDFMIPKDYVARAEAYDRRYNAGVDFDVKSHLPLERLVERRADTWLDQEIRRDATTALNADQGFGREFNDARRRRFVWLEENGFIERTGDRLSIRKGAWGELRQAELGEAVKQLSKQLGRSYEPLVSGLRRVEGRLNGHIDLASGRFAVIEQRSLEFTLVPWRDVLEHQRGREISGIIRGASIDWSFGRQRGLGR